MHFFSDWSVLTLCMLCFSLFGRWSVRHMLTEFLMVAILVYLQLTDRYAGVWSLGAAVISLVGTKSFASENELRLESFKNRWLILGNTTIYTILETPSNRDWKQHLLYNEYRRLNSVFLLLKRSWMASEFRSPSRSDNNSDGCGRLHNMELYKRISRFWLSIKSNMPTCYYSSQHAVSVSSLPHVLEELLAYQYEAYGCAGWGPGAGGQQDPCWTRGEHENKNEI